MDIGTAFKKPFTDIKLLIIGIILTIIPVINILTIPGYFLRIAKNTMAGDNKLPKFDNFGGLVVESIKAIVVGIIYMIIMMIVAAILGLIPLIGGVLSLIWMIVFAFVMISGMMTLAQTGDIGKALNIPDLFKKAKRANFIIAVIVGAIIVGIIMAIIMSVLLGATLFAMLPALMTGNLMALQGSIMSIVGVVAVGGIVGLIVGYVLEVFYVTLVAESYK